MFQASDFKLTQVRPSLVPQLTGSAANQLLAVLAGIALLTVSAHIKIPFHPVPLTMQTLIVLGIGMTYGARLGGATLLGYLAAGFFGLPVFAGGVGMAYMMGPTGGYLAGFFAAAVVLGALAERGWTRSWATAAAAMLMGNVIIYLLGVGWLSSLIGWEKAVQFGLLPFLYGDALKLIIAALGVPYLWSKLKQK
jgi:biotin transport system substrate-specific component